jgi:hypothetical protein
VDSFSYLVTFIALVPALALARGLGGAADLVYQALNDTPGRVRWSGLFVFFALGLVTTAAWEWWLLAGWADEGPFTFNTFQFLVLKPALLLFIARLFMPDVEAGTDVDLERHYFTVARWVYPLLAVLALLSLPATYLGVLDHFSPDEVASNTAVIAVWATICASLGFTRRRAWHWAGLVALNVIHVIGQQAYGTGTLP